LVAIPYPVPWWESICFRMVAGQCLGVMPWCRSCNHMQMRRWLSLLTCIHASELLEQPQLLTVGCSVPLVRVQVSPGSASSPDYRDSATCRCKAKQLSQGQAPGLWQGGGLFTTFEKAISEMPLLHNWWANSGCLLLSSKSFAFPPRCNAVWFGVIFKSLPISLNGHCLTPLLIYCNVGKCDSVIQMLFSQFLHD